MKKGKCELNRLVKQRKRLGGETSVPVHPLRSPQTVQHRHQLLVGAVGRGLPGRAVQGDAAL